MTYTAIVPVKGWAEAKSRLDLTSEIRGDLARAFAEDVITAVSGASRVDRVVVVSSEPDVLEVVRRCGAHLVADPDDARDGLNAAILVGAEWAGSRHALDPVVVVPADLPCLTAAALDTVLSAGGDRVVVPDAGGTGTTLLTCASPHDLRPTYGPDSAARHAALGHEVLLEVDPRLRRDVDSLADLAEAVALGVGESTAAALRRHSHAPG